jgi:PBP1b-binding outer membrane lipoprotein LpoB
LKQLFAVLGIIMLLTGCASQVAQLPSYYQQSLSKVISSKDASNSRRLLAGMKNGLPLRMQNSLPSGHP